MSFEFDVARKIKLFLGRELIENVIFDAELMVASTKIDSAIVIQKYAEKLVNSNPFVANELKSIARRLKSNQSKYDVYAGYVDQTILSLLRTADQKGLATSSLLNEYAPIRKVTLQNQNRIKSALTMPLILFVFITTILSVISSKLYAAKSAIAFSSITLFIMNHFLVINTIILIATITGFFLMPKKFPVLSKVYQKQDSLLAVALAQTMYAIGLSTKDIIPVIKRQFGIVGRNGKGDISELVKIFGENKLLLPKEMADLELAMDYSQFDEMLLAKRESKYEDAKQFGELVGEIVKNFSLLIIGAPIIQFVVIILDLIITSSAMATASGSH